MEQETDVYEFMRKTLVLPSFITPRFFDPSVYRYDRVCLDIRGSQGLMNIGEDLIPSVMVKEVIDTMVKKIFDVFDQTPQRGYYVETSSEMVSEFFTQPNTIIIDPSLYTYLLKSQHLCTNLNNLGSTGTVTEIGTFYGNSVYVNNGSDYKNNTLKTFDRVEGFIMFDSYTKEYDSHIYEFDMYFSVINPRQYHIFNEENSCDVRLRLDLLNNYELYRKTKEYIQSRSSS